MDAITIDLCNKCLSIAADACDSIGRSDLSSLLLSQSIKDVNSAKEAREVARLTKYQLDEDNTKINGI